MFISIILVAYNEDKFLSKCLLSLKKQTGVSFEILIVDDGSLKKINIDGINANNGVKIILPGANHPLSNIKIASYAQERYNILIPPEVLSNGGPATAAAFEHIYRQNSHEFDNIGIFCSKNPCE